MSLKNNFLGVTYFENLSLYFTLTFFRSSARLIVCSHDITVRVRPCVHIRRYSVRPRTLFAATEREGRMFRLLAAASNGTAMYARLQVLRTVHCTYYLHIYDKRIVRIHYKLQ